MPDTDLARSDGGWSDPAIVLRIGNLLRVGVIASAVFILLGGAVYLIHHGRERVVDRSTFEPMPAEFSRPGAIVRAALMGQGRDGGPFGPTVRAGQGRGRALIQLGLLLLIATPVLRVAFSIFAFARQRDPLYVLLPTVVLVVLIYGLFSGQMH
jgi:uncharacterized membrane protein